MNEQYGSGVQKTEVSKEEVTTSINILVHRHWVLTIVPENVCLLAGQHVNLRKYFTELTHQYAGGLHFCCIRQQFTQTRPVFHKDIQMCGNSS